MKWLLNAALMCVGTITCAQDLQYVHYVVDSLCSPKMAGRGYVDSGLDRSAAFVARQLDSLGVAPLADTRFQKFQFSVNAFPESQTVYIGNRELVPGQDFLVNSYSPSFSGKMPIQHIDSSLIENPGQLKLLPDVAFLIHPVASDNRDLASKRAGLIREVAQVGPVIDPVSKLTWSVAHEQLEHPIIEVVDTVVDWGEASSIELDIRAELKRDFEAANVIGLVPAQKKSKKYIVFTAHYDHLGKMGDALFPGANDNASGTAMLLDLAAHYAAHPPKKENVLFIAFAGEEAGLVGSKFFVDNPMVPLENIEFLINLDLTGNGEDGITVVNGKMFEKGFHRMAEINSKNDFVPKIRARGSAANSDHYWFSKNGVPAFFIYTHGERKAYHDIYDVPETLGFEGYEGLFELVVEFVIQL